MNISIKDFRVSFLLILVYAFLYLIPLNRKLLNQFYQQIQNLSQQIAPSKPDLFALMVTYLTAIVCLILFLYYKSEQKRITFGILMGITLFPFGIWVFQQENGFEPFSQKDFIKIWGQISVILLLYDFIRIKKFNGGY